MSRSPERMSSYRRHFEGPLAASSSYQVRISSPSPTRKDFRHRSASYSRSVGSMGRRNTPSLRKSRMTNSVSMGALCFAAAENQEFMSTRTGERKEMVALNDRLAIYTEKVCTLEGQNNLLEAEIDVLRNRYVKPSGLRQLYKGQLRELHRIAEQMRVQRDLAVADKGAMAGQVEVLKVKYEEALEERKKAELEIETYRPDMDRATSARIGLEKQLQNLEVELAFLTRVHNEVTCLGLYLCTVAKVDMTFALHDLSSALKQIQSQCDSIAVRNLQEIDAWYKSKFQDMNNVTTKYAQRKDVRLDAYDLKACVCFPQERIVGLELKVMKEQIALLLREYQELLNVKMALEIEITTYLQYHFQNTFVLAFSLRTVETEDMYESDKQERTITISGAADNTDED
uniref:Notochord granular surface n=1 Tax=Salmo trutta TaxID=8032 RepID=A0A673W1H2_SALTR